MRNVYIVVIRKWKSTRRLDSLLHYSKLIVT